MMSESLVLGSDPRSAVVLALLLVNLTGGLAILTVALARLPARRMLGPGAAYQLWLAPLIVALVTLLACLVPLDSERGSVVAAAAPQLALFAPIWALGAVAVAARAAIAQAHFMAEARAGRAGPAVVGLISPRILLPADDGTYSADERELIRAHEREHVAHKDTRATALCVLIQCLCWFNPLAHLAAHLMRLDQELARDAAVIMGRPGARALYARTLLKSQLAVAPLPFGCYWPARGRHPLEVRVALLKRRTDQGPPRLRCADDFRPPVAAIRP